MSIDEQVDNLQIDIKDDKSFNRLKESLAKYHEMTQSGILKPRENQIQSVYKPFEFYSNFS